MEEQTVKILIDGKEVYSGKINENAKIDIQKVDGKPHLKENPLEWTNLKYFTKDCTHVPEEWVGEAWIENLRPSTGMGDLIIRVPYLSYTLHELGLK